LLAMNRLPYNNIKQIISEFLFEIPFLEIILIDLIKLEYN